MLFYSGIALWMELGLLNILKAWIILYFQNISGISESILHQKKKKNYCLDFYYYFYEIVADVRSF